MKTIVILAALAAAPVLSGCMMLHGSHGGRSAPSKAVCPVCGTEVKVKKDTPSITWKGKTLYFDGEAHLKSFAEAPDAPGQEAAVPEGHGGHH